MNGIWEYKVLSIKKLSQSKKKQGIHVLQGLIFMGMLDSAKTSLLSFIVAACYSTIVPFYLLDANCI